MDAFWHQLYDTPELITLQSASRILWPNGGYEIPTILYFKVVTTDIQQIQLNNTSGHHGDIPMRKFDSIHQQTLIGGGFSHLYAVQLVIKN